MNRASKKSVAPTSDAKIAPDELFRPTVFREDVQRSAIVSRVLMRLTHSIHLNL